ncbi:hypothetical protein [Aeoliella mucimassa]|uniref:Uncharacterized protein n=1 Tax=Aeoliella mucimassa TaxID=2527972 RepID=A0A518ARB2_9BACT|nr:hypothetical protein [Aeoliella mucimassa]QDU57261.1 hypothetical protein Pan181_34760 [Aeoliella mucimassa]
MTAPVLMLLAPLLSVTFGYEPSSDAEVGYDYIVQVEPAMVEQMQRGNADTIEVNIPAEVNPIRRIRVVVGTEQLPKKLRPGAAFHTTFRPDLDSASIGLLAQTGPAGGYGRNADGFNGATTRSTTTNTAETAPFSIPPINTNPNTTTNNYSQDLRNSLESGFQAAETGLNNTTNAVRGTLNNVGSAGQGVVDNVRTTVSDVIAPPDTRTYNPQNTPLENTSNRLQQEFRSTTDAMRNSIDRAMQGNTQQPTNATANPNMANVDMSNLRPGETSLLNGVNPNANMGAANTAAPTSQAQAQYLTNQLIENQNELNRLRNQLQQSEQARRAAEASSSATLTPTNFPMQNVPDRTASNAVTPLGDRSYLTGNGNGIGNGNTSANTQLTNTANTNNNQANAAADNTNAPNAGNSTENSNFKLPPIEPAGTTTVNRVDADGADRGYDWAPNGGNSTVDNNDSSDEETTQTSGVPGAAIAWAFAIGLGVVNMFQWLNLVDMRNKYRVALRRNSPNFSRSMAA